MLVECWWDTTDEVAKSDGRLGLLTLFISTVVVAASLRKLLPVVAVVVVVVMLLLLVEGVRLDLTVVSDFVRRSLMCDFAFIVRAIVV
jgi:hypothetical protein